MIEILNDAHDIKEFDCGVESLNRYLHEHARANAGIGFGATYVLLEEGSQRVIGYYTVVAGQVEPKAFTSKKRREFPPHPVPVIRLARLAVDVTQKGKGLGGVLLADALLRALRFSESIAAHAVEVDAIDDAAKRFYEHHGFIALRDDPRHLYLPIETIRTFSQ
jgi:GNAT superfamily N-acetyltransferase